MDNNSSKWLSVEKDGYPYSIDDFDKIYSIDDFDEITDDARGDLLKDYLLTDGEDYFIGYWRPDAKAWDNGISGWVRKYYDGEGRDDSLANIKWYMELPKLPGE